ncbi:MAG: hypothetical protein HQK54_15560 [Oligoflexales bacterium]|nr:hypothetical protein [Oligoflexales bacterium]
MKNRVKTAFFLVSLITVILEGCGYDRSEEWSVRLSGSSSEDQQLYKKYALEDFEFFVPGNNKGTRLLAMVAGGVDADAFEKLIEKKIPAHYLERDHKPVEISENLESAEKQIKEQFPSERLFDVTSYFPKEIRQLFNRLSSSYSGPNCYNAALIASSLQKVDERTYVDLKEFELYLERYFDEVKKPQFGDLVLYDTEHSKDHAAFYLFNDLVFHKKGFKKVYRYRIVKSDDVLKKEPFELRPSTFDDYVDDPEFGKKAKKYYRRKNPGDLPKVDELKGPELKAAGVIQVMEKAAAEYGASWELPTNMGIISESLVERFKQEFSFLKDGTDNFEANLHYEKLNSLSSQIFQAIEEAFYSSPYADGRKVNRDYCYKENQYIRDLISAVFLYVRDRPPMEREIAGILDKMRAEDREKCNFDLMKMVGTHEMVGTHD